MFNRDAEEITIWLDNCAAQNKNWALYSFFVYYVNSNECILKSIKIKYLETGHTFMSADSFHHQVEKSLKCKGKVFDFQDYVECVRNSNNGRVDVVEMSVGDFYEFKDFSSKYKLTRTAPKPYMCRFREVAFVRGSNEIFYKTEFNGEQIKLNFLTAKTQKEGVPKAVSRKVPRGVDKLRKNNLIKKLGDIVPKNRLAFWEELPERSNEVTSDSE